jgi:phospholipid transport system substrate-binding protein
MAIKWHLGQQYRPVRRDGNQQIYLVLPRLRVPVFPAQAVAHFAIRLWSDYRMPYIVDRCHPLQGMVTNMNRTRTTIIPSLPWLFTALLIAALSMPLRAEPEPVAVLRQMTEQVQEAVRQDTSILKDPVRLRTLAHDLVLPHVDFVTLSRWVLGKHWRNATPAQREAFMAEFQEMLMSIYLGHVTDYRETSVQFQPLRAEPGDDRVEVQAEVEPRGAPVVNVMFRMHQVDDQWLIYDVSVEGISLVATHRSGFSQEISRNGLDGLISRLADMNHAAVAAGEKCVGC